MRATAPMFVLFALALALGACRESSSDKTAEPNQPQLRIASLSPALTSTLIALGGERFVVGRTPWCHVSGEVAVVGSLLDLDAEALVQTQPALVLVQPPAQGSPSALDRLARDGGWRVESFRVDSIQDVKDAIARLAALLSEYPDQLQQVPVAQNSRLLLKDLDDALTPIESASRLGRTLILLVGSESGDPLGFGPDTYIGGALAAMGVENALTRDGYPVLSWEAITRLTPKTIIVIGPRGGEARVAIRRILPGALVGSLDAPELMQPGAGMVAALRAFRATLTEVAK